MAKIAGALPPSPTFIRIIFFSIGFPSALFRKLSNDWVKQGLSLIDPNGPKRDSPVLTHSIDVENQGFSCFVGIFVDCFEGDDMEFFL